jgi:hypothetical protein
MANTNPCFGTVRSKTFNVWITETWFILRWLYGLEFCQHRYALSHRHLEKRRKHSTHKAQSIQDDQNEEDGKSPAKPLRIMESRPPPPPDWARVWDNVGKTFLLDNIQSTWSRVVHDIIPTRVRLFKIHLHAIDTCPRCDQTDTLIHGVTTCGAVIDRWQWIRNAIARPQIRPTPVARVS